ncbi:hypothetical protein like AT3G26040 [Hibiscus trionum]|uniref:Uncharacterized protein n=1 Tax=Hibiscus trionum TaxID=183268 RepID=A0A9W7LIN2_HIBTR|nr:hypothetical protein like AT3G26040 [Hibiscus trionum]
MEVHIISKEMVKPSSEEVHLRKPFSLSLLDQFSPPVYIPLMFFYSKPNGSHFDTVQTLAGLKKSFSKALNQYYPLSGRTIDHRCVGSYDKGVPYVEARVKGCLADCVAQTEQEWVKQLLPSQPFCSIPTSTSPQLAIQINVFDCGGIAIVVLCSHKVMDAITSSAFMKSWAAFNRGSNGEIPNPDMLDIGSRLFPPLESIPQNYSSLIEGLWLQEGWRRTRRFVFDDNAISTLKFKAKSKRFEHPTRIVALAAFLWKYAMLASRVASGRWKPSALNLLVNLRPRLKSRLPQYSIGNLLCTAVSTFNPAERDIELDHLAYLVRESIDNVNDQISRSQNEDVVKFMSNQYNPIIELAARGEVDLFGCSSWLNTLDGNMVDFGWGEPTSFSVWRAETRYYSFANLFVLKEMGKDKGIEAVVTLDAKTMDILEHDSEFLAIASPASGPYLNKCKV